MIKLFKFLGAILFCITQANADTSEVLLLTLRYSNGSISEGAITIIPGFIKQSFDCNTCKSAGYMAKIYNSKGEVLHSTAIGDPSFIFYDYLSDEGKFTGGVVKVQQREFVIRLPYLSDMEEVKIISPQGKKCFRITKQKLRKTNEKTLWPCSTLINNGPVENRVDLVILGDGYTSTQLSTYYSDVNAFVNYLSSVVSPYKEYLSYYNIHRVDVISQESGADHPLQNIYVNTELDASYSWGGGPERLLYCNEGKAWAAAASAPSADVVIVIVNDNTYGGGGGGVAVAYHGDYMKEVVTHEVGHSFGRLMDEYSYGTTGGLYFSGANCEYDYNQTNPKWQVWADQGTGWYATCSYTNLGRPTYASCMMRALMDEYCVVCREQVVKQIYNYMAALIDSVYPVQDSVTIPLDDTATLKITKKPTSPYTNIKWWINDTLQQGANKDSFLFIPQDTGLFKVMVTVHDTTPMVRRLPPNLIVEGSEKIWNIEVRLVGVQETNESKESVILYLTSTNPFNNFISLRYRSAIKTNARIGIYDISGRLIALLVDKEIEPGEHQIEWRPKTLSRGIYFARLVAGNCKQTQKFILIE